MNWVLILVIVILAGYTIAGYTKGFLKIVYSLISWLLILVFVTWATPYVNEFLRSNTNIYEKVYTYCEENIRERMLEQMENGEGVESSALTENELLAALFENIPIESIKGILDSVAGSADEYLEMQGVYASLAGSMADTVIEGISLLASILMGAIASSLIVQILGFIGHLPLIGFANRICGLAAGAANGLLIVWIGFCLVAIWGTTEFGSEILTLIYGNEFLITLYENNILLPLIIK